MEQMHAIQRLALTCSKSFFRYRRAMPLRITLFFPCITVSMYASILVATPVFAQATGGASTPSATADSTAPVVYLPADFARFAPRTALDMVMQIPGFTLSNGNDDRGLGQASQNVLVNGQRVASKTTDARATLQQISASAVIRIELVDGARLGIPGLSGRVANVIVRSAQVRVQFRWEGQQRPLIEDQIFTGNISASGRIGATDFTLGLTNDGARRGGTGPEIVTDAAGAIILTRQQFDSFHQDAPTLAGTLKRQWSNGSILNLNLSVQNDIFTGRFIGVATPASGSPITDEVFRRNRDEWSYEGGGDYEFDIGNGRLKVILLQSIDHTPVVSTFTNQVRSTGSTATGSRFSQVFDSGESVVRSEYGWQTASGSWQLALEGAYNFLDVTSALFSLQPDGSFTPVPLPGSTTFVDEWRGEATVTRGWTISPAVTLQATVGAEYSRLRQTSAGGLSRSFIRPKGSLSLAWTASPRLTVNTVLRRRVGQLSFSDFSSAVDLQNNNNSAGNVNLVPEQTWRLELEAVRSLGNLGSVTIGGFAEAISDIVDRIPISPTEEGVGNLPSAQRVGIFGRGTLVLDQFGWRGGRINFSGDFRTSRVRDPLTGDRRRISADPIRSWSVELRHDIPDTAIAWGAFIGELTIPGLTYRLDQVSSSQLTRPVIQIYIEHKDVLGLTVRLALRNLLDTRDFILRDVYVDRRNGPIDFRERHLRGIGLIGALTISGSF